jgi:hypothetical protein
VERGVDGRDVGRGFGRLRELGLHGLAIECGGRLGLYGRAIAGRRLDGGRRLDLGGHLSRGCGRRLHRLHVAVRRQPIAGVDLERLKRLDGLERLDRLDRLRRRRRGRALGGTYTGGRIGRRQHFAGRGLGGEQLGRLSLAQVRRRLAPRRAERLGLLAGQLLVGGAALALELQVLANRVVENSHGLEP